MTPDHLLEPNARPRYHPPPPILPSKAMHSGLSDSASSSAVNLVGPAPLLVADARPSPPSSYPPQISNPPLLPRRRMTRVACEACRKRRAKCSGDRPRCAACAKHDSECHYASASPSETYSQALKRKCDETREETNMYKELYQYLRRLPENQGQEVLHRIRRGDSVMTIVRQIKDGDLLLQMSLVPEIHLRYEFPYRAAMPLAITQSNNAYLSSILHEALYIDDQDQARDQNQEQISDQGKKQEQQRQIQSPTIYYSAAYMKPYHAAKHIEPLLSAVDVTKWTSVISDNDLFVALLSAYFFHEYLAYPVFQKEIFLRAMVDGDDRFCSPLLVNALLAEACHCYHAIPKRSQYWDPLSLPYRFLAETKRLWEMEVGKANLVNTQAAVMLNVVYTHNGLDLPGRIYLLQAISMGQEMGLFGPDVLVPDEQLSNARLFTAWGIYRWAAVMGYHFQTPPLMTGAPVVPLPDPDENPEWFGDFNIQYPLSETLFTTSHGHLFKAWSDLRAIANDLGLAIYSGHGPAAIHANKYLEFHEQLDKWFSSLPVVLQPRNIVWPSQFNLHMEYHVVLIRMSQMQILKRRGPATAEEDKLWAAARKTAAETLPHAVIQLETVMRLYYLRHSFEYCDIYMSYFLWTLANIVMEFLRGKQAIPAFKEVPDSPEHLWSTLVLCLNGMANQGRYSHMVGFICRLLFKRQTPEDATIIRRYIPLDILEDQSAMAQHVHSACPLHGDRASENPDVSRPGDMVRHLYEPGVESPPSRVEA